MYVDLSNNGKQYSKSIPIGCNFIGSVSDDKGHNSGALVYNKITGLYHQLNRGILVSLDQNDVAIAIAKAMNEQSTTDIPMLNSVKKLRSVNLDDETMTIMRNYGHGNVSLGIRRAAELIKKGNNHG